MLNGFINPPTTYSPASVSRFGTSVREIFTLDDFNPSGGIITLEAGHYQIKDFIDIGVNRFVFESGAPTVLMQFDDSFNHWIEHSGSNMALFSGEGALRLLHGKGNAFFLTGNNVEFVDIIGSLGSLYTYIEFTGTGGSLGTVRSKSVELATAGLILRENVINGWEGGFTVIGGTEASMRDTGGVASDNATGAFLKVIGSGEILLTKEAFMTIPATASYVDIDPTVETPATIDNIYLSGAGSFFTPSTKSGTFTAVADASIGATGITGVTDSSGTARFAFTGPTVYVNQKIVISGFTTNPEYNGTWIIDATDGTSYFEITGLDYGSNETGSFLSNSITLTEASTTVADGDTILIDSDSATTYDCGSYVYNKLTNSFQVNATWVATATGSWRNGSQNEQSKYVTVRNCGEQRDSKNLSAVYVTGNTDTITATDGSWVDLDLGTASDSTASSRFKLVDAVTGEVEYTGINPVDGVLTASISAFKSAATAILHQFRAYKSNGTPAFETIIAEEDLTNTLSNLTLSTPVRLEPGDRFKLQIKAIGATTTVTIQNITCTVIA